jgi:para-nitrobenzyl esterase
MRVGLIRGWERESRALGRHAETEITQNTEAPVGAGEKTPMRPILHAAVLATTAASALCSQAPPPKDPEVGIAQLALTNAPANGNAKLTVTTPAFKNMGDIPLENTQYEGNKFPGLEWTAGPAGTKTYVVIMQDTDILRNGAPILHWTMVDIPASMTSLPAGMTEAPAGTMHGPNIRGTMQPYMGPRTPAGPKHRYHIQVFALDNSVGTESMQSYDAMLAAMKGHVLASGEVIGLGSAPAK